MKSTLTDTQQTSKVETIPAVQLAAELKKTPTFASVSSEDLALLGNVRLMHAAKDADVFHLTGVRNGFWIVLEGQLRLVKREEDGSFTPLGTVGPGDTTGEVPLLAGKDAKTTTVTAIEPAVVAYFDENAFWHLMFRCAKVREVVLGNMARRLQLYQSQALHREKLISLGTLAAGLMHELNNPGAAARRAASQLRENLQRLQMISLRLCSGERKTSGQVDCLRRLQEQAMEPEKPRARGSLEQSDAEESLADWLEGQGIANAWKLAPTLTAIGIDMTSLQCAQQEFQGGALSDPLNWVEALVSSVQLVDTIEESVSRVTDLVKAVKKYGYEDKSERHEVDIHDSIQSTLIILGHKFREKELTVVKEFGPGVKPISTCGRGLNQVWTNLLDNAIDAAPQKGVITVRTWVEGPHTCVSIGDNGPGIPPETRSHIFEPFFTTKPVGEGTGLGLDIVHRIVVGQYGGHIQLESEPGKTEFIVMLPAKT